MDKIYNIHLYRNVQEFNFEHNIRYELMLKVWGNEKLTLMSKSSMNCSKNSEPSILLWFAHLKVRWKCLSVYFYKTNKCLLFVSIIYFHFKIWQWNGNKLMKTDYKVACQSPIRNTSLYELNAQQLFKTKVTFTIKHSKS